MKRAVIIMLFILSISAPSYAQNNQHPIKNIIKKVRAFFRGSPFAIERKQIQKEYDDNKISKEEFDNRMDDVDRREEDARELKRQMAEQRKAQASAQQAGN